MDEPTVSADDRVPIRGDVDILFLQTAKEQKI